MLSVYKKKFQIPGRDLEILNTKFYFAHLIKKTLSKSK